ncbi:hypothetical protein [Nodularia spumigena]|nr:hypothetical protein [Nodularia spumigena]
MNHISKPAPTISVAWLLESVNILEAKPHIKCSAVWGMSDRSTLSTQI